MMPVTQISYSYSYLRLDSDSDRAGQYHEESCYQLSSQPHLPRSLRPCPWPPPCRTDSAQTARIFLLPRSTQRSCLGCTSCSAPPVHSMHTHTHRERERGRGRSGQVWCGVQGDNELAHVMHNDHVVRSEV